MWVLSGAAGAADGDIQCGSVITEDTVLTHDLLDCEGDGLIIAAQNENVMLDLGGHQMVGRGTGDGVRFVYGFSGDAVIRNGTIRGFLVGVKGGSDSGATLSYLDIASNERAGVNAISGSMLIENSTIHHNGVGISLQFPRRGSNHVIVGNRIMWNQQIGIYSSSNNVLRLEGNLVRGNGGSGGYRGTAGVYLEESHAVVLGNTFSRNGGHGLGIYDLYAGDLNELRVGSNLADENVGLGIVAWGEPPWPSSFDAGGNAANKNGDPMECAVMHRLTVVVDGVLACARNRGQANKLTPLTAEQAEAKHDEN